MCKKKYNKFSFLYLFILLAGITLPSCNSTYTLTNNQYLLNNNRVKTKINSLDKDEINAIIKQQPNKKLFGFFRFYLYAYNYTKIGKNNKFKAWVSKTIAEEPVILDTLLTDKSVKQLKLYLQKKGYFNAVVFDTIVYKNRKANVFYTLIGNTPYKFESVKFEISDIEIKRIIQENSSFSVLKPGDLFDQNNIELERERLTTLIRNNGYYKFNKDYIKLIADSNQNKINAKIVVENPTEKNDTTHKKYRIGLVYIYTDFNITNRSQIFKDTANYDGGYNIIFNDKLKFKKDVLIKPVFFEPSKIFMQQDVEDTYKRYQSLRVFSNVNLDFKERLDSNKNILDAQVRLSPLRKQSYSFEGEGTNSSGYFGIRGNIIYQNKK